MQTTTKYEYLRVTFQQTRNDEDELNKIVEKANKVYQSMKKQFLNKEELSKQTKIEILQQLGIYVVVRQGMKSNADEQNTSYRDEVFNYQQIQEMHQYKTGLSTFISYILSNLYENWANMNMKVIMRTLLQRN